MLLPVVKIAHYGYKDEGTRKERFARNLPLILRDREENPERILGKFLWLRDLAQMRDLVTDLLEGERLGQGHACLLYTSDAADE